MRFHLPALPGQPVGGSKGRSVCAFTEKVRKFPAMMKPLGHEVIVYGDPDYEHEGEHVACYPSLDAPPEFSPEAWQPFNEAAAKAIKERAEPGDVLGLMGGLAQHYLVGELPDLWPVEYGIGYGGSFAPYRIFESYAWMHTTYGQQRGTNSADGSFFDEVINAYFEPEVFPSGKDGGYLLYVGRLTERKGIEIVTETAKRLGMPLKLAGAGDWVPNYGEALGIVGPKERGELMANATALMCPTIYIEPFGCIAVEAQLSGTPVISTDWGAYTETVRQGESGYRCHTLGEFMWAVENVGNLNRKKIRKYAQERWSLKALAPEYDLYFRRLAKVRGDGWYDTTLDSPLPSR